MSTDGSGCGERRKRTLAGVVAADIGPDNRTRLWRGADAPLRAVTGGGHLRRDARLALRGKGDKGGPAQQAAVARGLHRRLLQHCTVRGSEAG